MIAAPSVASACSASGRTFDGPQPNRPSARYIGPDPRKPEDVEGWNTIKTKATTQVAPA